MTAFAERITELPQIYDAARGADVLASALKALREVPALAASAELLAAPKSAALLEAVFSASPYLAALAGRSPHLLLECLTRDPDTHLADARAALAEDVAQAAGQKEVMTLLRQFKQRTALLTALADLGGVWPTAVTLRALSETADASVQEAVAFLFRKAREAGQVTGQEDAAGYFVIAMGKLGAMELNYSSDIDFMVFYDTEFAGLAADVEPSSFFVRLTRDLVRLLQEHTGDGYVYRTDLRLRPDPGATQIALSTDAGLTYYESFGQNWERAALIKARIAAGDVALGGEFLDQLAPFIWRKYLDFAAVADIHAMKRRVHAFKGHGAIAVEGHDIKLGRGGIRDIEFFAQTQQLIAGGRHPELRTRGTIETLEALAGGGWIEPQTADDLTRAYYFLRRIENRIQMVGDEQTHIIPADRAELDRLARLAGFDDTDAFGDALLAQFKLVEAHYGALFEKIPEAPTSAPGIVVADENDPATLASLKQLGFDNPEAAVGAIRAWQSGRYAATRSAKSRERLTEFLPLLLDAFGRTSEPDLALATFDKVIASMPAGLQLFSLLAANPSLLRLVADIMGTAPRLANIIGRRPRLLDAVLDPGFFGAVPTPAKLKELVGTALELATDYQDALDRARIVGREQGFLIGVRVMSGTISARQAGAAYGGLAETLIEALAGFVGEELESQYGRMPGGETAVVAMGKLGGREMTAASDLDLVTVYDFTGDDAHSDGERSLPGTQYYTRFTQRLIAALSAQTAEGALYEVDMRLRPSGSQGPVATKLSSFVDYQTGSAWTWEHLALTRARVVTGPVALRLAINDTIRSVLSRPRDRVAVAEEVRAMRARIADEKGTADIWDLKQVRGGLIDLEFLAQFLQLVSAAEHPEVLDQNTEMALTKLSAAGVLSPGDSEILIPAARLYHTLTQILRLCLDKPFAADKAPLALRELLARASDMPDFDTLEATLKDTLGAVHEAFDRLVA
ncbi:glutamine-synthetase adenylyltransferase [Methyloceanibacter superfactus]|uniref:Bifunctional glutamine synthetase adenylyltransferase/adenylyl-removing enzyme n=1 Tax=Methyloceanibacter superfactus TaxID=1774969 RepID=A0A1E3W1N5_9HYPH|nr:bifunctional [glutamine synthetase] adenylyltransferase/[glutamine synthetase]-adenylyl-L-tyrosine phosphorylase [Methyloceanibacter superfactus]ODR99690.1 glutamine-synthetase adenylyltransferase [Methyloceanibacter superfactus]